MILSNSTFLFKKVFDVSIIVRIAVYISLSPLKAPKTNFLFEIYVQKNNFSHQYNYISARSLLQDDYLVEITKEVLLSNLKKKFFIYII